MAETQAEDKQVNGVEDAHMAEAVVEQNVPAQENSKKRGREEEGDDAEQPPAKKVDVKGEA